MPSKCFVFESKNSFLLDLTFSIQEWVLLKICMRMCGVCCGWVCCCRCWSLCVCVCFLFLFLFLACFLFLGGGGRPWIFMAALNSMFLLLLMPVKWRNLEIFSLRPDHYVLYCSIPFYLTVRMVYGAEVTRELTPMWVLGPLIVALYVKIIQGLCSLYVSSFMLSVRLVKNFPSYYRLVYNYIAEGKLKAYLHSCFWKPVEDVKNMDYKQLFARKMKQLQEWAVEKYLDYVESIWPYYCRTIRFLKKANLI